MAESRKAMILVVDDEPDAVEFIKAVMEEAGHEVVSASNGADGLKTALAQSPDLIILDVQMPGEDGFTTFARMRKRSELEGVPIVMLTGVGEKLGLRFSAEAAGQYVGDEPDGYIEKPVAPAILHEKVRRLLER